MNLNLNQSPKKDRAKTFKSPKLEEERRVGKNYKK